MKASLFALLMVPCVAAAMEFRSVGDAQAIFYESPVAEAKKLFIVTRDYPVEVIVNIEGWSKVRDRTGTLAWVQRKSLADKRTVVVSVPVAEIRRDPNKESTLVFRAEQNVALDWLATGDDGWLKVRHRDGQIGYIRINQIWGA